MTTQLLELPTNLPLQIGNVKNTPITTATCLEFIKQHAKTVQIANFALVGAGCLVVFKELVWVADKAAPKRKDDVRHELLKAFGETAGPNSNISRSKRYEFAGLCIAIARHKEMRPLAINAAKCESLESAVSYLVTEFAKIARSVAELARYFGTERTSGRHRDPVKRPFLLLLRALVERAEKDEEKIPFVDAVKVLTPAAVQREIFELVKQLIPHTTDDALPELIDIASRTIERRRASV